MKNSNRQCVQCSGPLSKNNYSGTCQNCKNENARNAKKLCILCIEKPRKVYASGLISSYCIECKKKTANYSHNKCCSACNRIISNDSDTHYCSDCLSKNIVKGDQLCRICRQRKRHISSSGRMSSYCSICISDFEKRRRKIPAIRYSKLKIGWLEKGINIPTREQYEEMMQEADGVCPACGREPKNKQAGLVLHHNHTTGEWIGLLCAHCNATLGYMDEDEALLHRLYEYSLRMGH